MLPSRKTARIGRILKRTLKYTVGAGVLGGLTTLVLIKTDEGFNRQSQFYLRAMPILAHYKYVEQRHKWITQPRIDRIAAKQKKNDEIIHQNSTKTISTTSTTDQTDNNVTDPNSNIDDSSNNDGQRPLSLISSETKIYRKKGTKDNPLTLEEEYEILHEKYADRVLDVILELKGLYVKAGQFATSRPDVTPASWIERLRTLQDGVTPQNMEYVTNVIESELGHKMSDIFLEFDEKSLGAASIGQAHRAVLNPEFIEKMRKQQKQHHLDLDEKIIDSQLPNDDNNHNSNNNNTNNNNTNTIPKEVCVKLQYPEMERVFAADLKAIRTFVGFLEPAIGDALKEMESQFLKEFDYRLECENLLTAYNNLMNPPLNANKETIDYFNSFNFRKHVAIPKAYPLLCTKNLLIMDYLKGDKLEIAIRKKLKEYVKKMNLDKEFEIESEIKNEDGTTSELSSMETLNKLRKQMLTKNSAQDMENRYLKNSILGKLGIRLNIEQLRTLVNIRRFFYNSLVWLYNHSLVYLYYPLVWDSKQLGDKLPLLEYDLPIVSNPWQFIQTLLNIHGYQIFINHAFNGDPHPGNILLLDDGKLGLIDYGQFKYLNNEEATKVSKLYMALASGNRENIVGIAKEMGFKSKKMDAEYIEKFTVFGFDRIDLKFREGKSTYEFINDLRELDDLEHIPGNYYLVQRTVFLLRGLAQLLQYEVSVAKHWRPFAQHYLEKVAAASETTE